MKRWKREQVYVAVEQVEIPLHRALIVEVWIVRHMRVSEPKQEEAEE